MQQQSNNQESQLSLTSKPLSHNDILSLKEQIDTYNQLNKKIQSITNQEEKDYQIFKNNFDFLLNLTEAIAYKDSTEQNGYKYYSIESILDSILLDQNDPNTNQYLLKSFNKLILNNPELSSQLINTVKLITQNYALKSVESKKDNPEQKAEIKEFNNKQITRFLELRNLLINYRQIQKNNFVFNKEEINLNSDNTKRLLQEDIEIVQEINKPKQFSTKQKILWSIVAGLSAIGGYLGYRHLTHDNTSKDIDLNNKNLEPYNPIFNSDVQPSYGNVHGNLRGTNWKSGNGFLSKSINDTIANADSGDDIKDKRHKEENNFRLLEEINISKSSKYHPIGSIDTSYGNYTTQEIFTLPESNNYATLMTVNNEKDPLDSDSYAIVRVIDREGNQVGDIVQFADRYSYYNDKSHIKKLPNNKGFASSVRKEDGGCYLKLFNEQGEYKEAYVGKTDYTPLFLEVFADGTVFAWHEGMMHILRQTGEYKKVTFNSLGSSAIVIGASYSDNLKRNYYIDVSKTRNSGDNAESYRVCITQSSGEYKEINGTSRYAQYVYIYPLDRGGYVVKGRYEDGFHLITPSGSYKKININSYNNDFRIYDTFSNGNFNILYKHNFEKNSLRYFNSYGNQVGSDITLNQHPHHSGGDDVAKINMKNNISAIDVYYDYYSGGTRHEGRAMRFITFNGKQIGSDIAFQKSYSPAIYDAISLSNGSFVLRYSQDGKNYIARYNSSSGVEISKTETGGIDSDEEERILLPLGNGGFIAMSQNPDTSIYDPNSHTLETYNSSDYRVGSIMDKFFDDKKIVSFSNGEYIIFPDSGSYQKKIYHINQSGDIKTLTSQPKRSFNRDNVFITQDNVCIIYSSSCMYFIMPTGEVRLQEFKNVSIPSIRPIIYEDSIGTNIYNHIYDHNAIVNVKSFQQDLQHKLDFNNDVLDLQPLVLSPEIIVDDDLTKFEYQMSILYKGNIVTKITIKDKDDNSIEVNEGVMKLSGNKNTINNTLKDLQIFLPSISVKNTDDLSLSYNISDLSQTMSVQGDTKLNYICLDKQSNVNCDGYIKPEISIDTANQLSLYDDSKKLSCSIDVKHPDAENLKMTISLKGLSQQDKDIKIEDILKYRYTFNSQYLIEDNSIIITGSQSYINRILSNLRLHSNGITQDFAIQYDLQDEGNDLSYSKNVTVKYLCQDKQNDSQCDGYVDTGLDSDSNDNEENNRNSDKSNGERFGIVFGTLCSTLLGIVGIGFGTSECYRMNSNKYKEAQELAKELKPALEILSNGSSYEYEDIKEDSINKINKLIGYLEKISYKGYSFDELINEKYKMGDFTRGITVKSFLPKRLHKFNSNVLNINRHTTVNRAITQLKEKKEEIERKLYWKKNDAEIARLQNEQRRAQRVQSQQKANNNYNQNHHQRWQNQQSMPTIHENQEITNQQIVLIDQESRWKDEQVRNLQNQLQQEKQNNIYLNSKLNNIYEGQSSISGPSDIADLNSFQGLPVGQKVGYLHKKNNKVIETQVIQIQSQKNTINQQSSQIERLKEQIEERDAAIMVLEEELRNAEMQMEELQEKISDYQHNDNEDYWQNKIRVLNNKINATKDELRIESQQRAKLEAKIYNQQSQLQALQGQTNTIVEEIQKDLESRDIQDMENAMIDKFFSMNNTAFKDFYCGMMVAFAQLEAEINLPNKVKTEMKGDLVRSQGGRAANWINSLPFGGFFSAAAKEVKDVVGVILDQQGLISDNMKKMKDLQFISPTMRSEFFQRLIITYMANNLDEISKLDSNNKTTQKALDTLKNIAKNKDAKQLGYNAGQLAGLQVAVEIMNFIRDEKNKGHLTTIKGAQKNNAVDIPKNIAQFVPELNNTLTALAHKNESKATRMVCKTVTTFENFMQQKEREQNAVLKKINSTLKINTPADQKSLDEIKTIEHNKREEGFMQKIQESQNLHNNHNSSQMYQSNQSNNSQLFEMANIVQEGPNSKSQIQNNNLQKNSNNTNRTEQDNDDCSVVNL